MADINQFHDEIFDEFKPEKKLPDMLNVLTILTFIASGFSLLYAPYTYYKICDQAIDLESKVATMGESNGFLAKMMKDSVDMAHRGCELRLPVLIVTIVFLLITLIGAIMMRKLNKKGFFIYLIGEVALPIAILVLLGGSTFSTVTTIFFPVLFIILYGTQLKHMK